MAKAACKVTLEELKDNMQAYAMSAEGVAIIMKAWYEGFVKAGFDTMQSMYLTSNMGAAMFMTAQYGDGGKQK